MNILSRYILREIAGYFALSLLAFTGLFLTLQLLRYANLIINKGVEFTQIARVFLAIIPTFLELAIPMGALLGVMLAFARLSGDSEIVVMRASGISLRHMIRPVTVFALTLGLCALVVSLHLKPWGYGHLSQTLFEIARTKSTAGLSPGVFNNLGTLTLYADDITDKNGNLERVLIDDRRDSKARKIIIAQSGKISSDDEARNILFLLRDGSIHELVDNKYILTDFVTNNLVMSAEDLYDPASMRKEAKSRELTNQELQSELIRFQQLRRDLEVAQLPAEDETPESTSAVRDDESTDTEGLENDEPQTDEWNLRRVNKKINGIRIELAKRLSMPFAAFILALVAMPLGVQPPRAQRTWGAGLSVVIGMIVFVVYYGVLSLSIALAERGSIHPEISVWIPNVLAALVAFYCLKKVGSEQWQSVAQALEGLWNRLRLIARRVE